MKIITTRTATWDRGLSAAHRKGAKALAIAGNARLAGCFGTVTPTTAVQRSAAAPASMAAVSGVPAYVVDQESRTPREAPAPS